MGIKYNAKKLKPAFATGRISVVLTYTKVMVILDLH